MRIEVSRPDVSRIKVSVVDTGIGISAVQIPKLFERFSQADSSTTRRYGGTGLGLAISKRLVELMGGEIGVASAPGQGSTFSFVLPLLDAAPESRPAAPLAAPLARAGTRPPEALDHPVGLQLLLVEDNPVNQRARAAHAREDGPQRGSGAERPRSRGAPGRASLRSGAHGLQMPEMDGLEATAYVRSPASAVRDRAIPSSP